MQKCIENVLEAIICRLIGGINACANCKVFLATLDQKIRCIQKTMEVHSALGVTVGSVPDRRGKQPSANKTPGWQCEIIMQHIQSYPTIESHYCRKTSQRKYLDARLTIRKMYEQFTEYHKNRFK